MLRSTTQWDGHGVRRIMVDAIGHLCHKPPRTIYGIQMAREELQVIWFGKPTSSAKITHKSHTYLHGIKQRGAFSKEKEIKSTKS
jgi:hypothetical protein